MIPAIAQQFHHLSLAMTEEGYIGNDPTLLDCFDSVRTRETARFLYEMCRGKRPASGRLAKLIESHCEELEAIIAGCDEKSGMKAMESWVVRQDIRIWYANHGKCLLQLAPMKSRCHEAAGTSHWANRAPNFSMRTPELCVGCPVFAVDGEHADFWMRRYTENMTAWNGAEASGLTADYRVAEYRALQSAAVLQAIGVGLPSLKGEDQRAAN